MTGKRRILAAFHGEHPDTVPFCPNLYYWFYNRLATGTLPPELAGTRHPFDALRALGADILARWDTQHPPARSIPPASSPKNMAGRAVVIVR